MANIVYSSWDAASYSWGTGKTRCRLVYSVSSTATTTTITIGSDDYLSAVQCHSTYNMSQYGVKVTSGHKGGGGKSAAYNYSTGIMDGSSNWKAKVAKRSYSFPRKTSAYNVTIYTSYVGQVVSGYGAMKNSGSVTKSITIPALTSYVVKYDANGGSNAPSTQTKYYGASLTLSSKKPTRTNYTFKGWATSKTATTATYKAGGTYTANSATTLYAVWEMNYEKPTIPKITVARCDKDGNESALGKYVNVGFRWTADEKLLANSIIPLVSGTVKCIQGDYQSSASVAAEATASGYKSNIIIGGGLNPIVDCSITVEIKDGAGQSALKGRVLAAEPYTAPVISNIKAIRANGDGSSNDEGTSGYISFHWSVDEMGGENNVTSMAVGYRELNSEDSYQEIVVDYDSEATSGTATANVVALNRIAFNGVIDGLEIYERSIITMVETETETDGSTDSEETGDGVETETVLVPKVEKVPYYKFSDIVLIESNLIGGTLNIISADATQTTFNITKDNVDTSTNGVVIIKRNDEPIAYAVSDGTLLGGINPGLYLARTDAEYISEIVYSIDLLDLAKSYEIIIIVEDALSSTTKYSVISRAFFTMDFKAGGKGIAMGKTADKDGFECDMKATFNQGLIENIPVLVNGDCNELTASGKYYLGVNATNRPKEKVNDAEYDRNGWLESKLYGNDYCHQTYTTYTGSSYARTMTDGVWGNWMSTYSTNADGNLLWKDVAWMGESNNVRQEITLSESVLEQQHGIVLVFSYYNVDTKQAQNYNFHSFFVSKGFVNSHRGYGSGFVMQRNGFFHYKHLFIYPTRIVGHSVNNNTSHTLHGQTINNCKMVLREVWGV